MASPLYLSLLAGPVEAVPVPKPVMDSFVSAQVTESATGRSGFQLTFTLADDSPLQALLLVPLLRVILFVTYAGLPQVLVDGVIEQYEIQPEGMSGSPRLVVTGHDLSALMDLIDLTGLLAYPCLTPDLRVESILARYAAFGIVPAVIPVPAPDVPDPLGTIPQHQGTDLGYINSLAGDAGYVFYLVPGPVPGMNQGYFGPQIRVGMPQPALSVNMDAWTNVESLTFTYQPLGSAAPVVYIAVPGTGIAAPVPIPPVTPFNPPLGAFVPPPAKIHELPGTAKLSIAQALMLGMADAVKNADVVSGNGTLTVDRYGQVLRARSLVGVRGAGIALDGLHFVDSVTHDIKPGEYKQSFTLKRNALIANLPVVPALPY